MAPHRHIAHIREKHIGLYVINYVSIVSMCFKLTYGCFIRKVN